MKKFIPIVLVLVSILYSACSKKTSTYPGKHNQQRGNTCLDGC